MKVNRITLKVLRVLAGFSQVELSRRVGTSQGYISGIEKGDKTPSPKMLKDIADALGVPSATLLREPTEAQLAEADIELEAA